MAVYKFPSASVPIAGQYWVDPMATRPEGLEAAGAAESAEAVGARATEIPPAVTSDPATTAAATRRQMLATVPTTPPGCVEMAMSATILKGVLGLPLHGSGEISQDSQRRLASGSTCLASDHG